jgi:hypothetical protein
MASDPRTKRSAHAIVVVTLDVEVDSSWGGDCTVDQVHKQAADEATGTLRFIFQEANKSTSGCTRKVRVREIPKVTAVMSERELP